MEKATVFGVYGTLKQGGSNHDLLEHPNVEFMGNDATQAIYTMIDLGEFPAVVPLGTTSIRLEVYRTDDNWILERLNQLEGFKGEDNPNNLYDFVEAKTMEFNRVHIYQMKLSHPWIEKRKGVITNGKWNIPKKDRELPRPNMGQPMKAANPIELPKFKFQAAGRVQRGMPKGLNDIANAMNNDPIPIPKDMVDHLMLNKVHNRQIDENIQAEKVLLIQAGGLNRDQLNERFIEIEERWNAKRIL